MFRTFIDTAEMPHNVSLALAPHVLTGFVAVLGPREVVSRVYELCVCVFDGH